MLWYSIEAPLRDDSNEYPHGLMITETTPQNQLLILLLNTSSGSVFSKGTKCYNVNSRQKIAVIVADYHHFVS